MVRQRHPDNNRNTIVKLLPDGKKLHEKQESVFNQCTVRFFESLGEEKAALFVELQREMVDFLLKNQMGGPVMSDAIVITKRKRTLIFLNIVFACIATSMLATALTTALPDMIRDFNISVTTGQWLTSGYSLAMGIMMPLTAFLINRFPTRKLYLTAIIGFLAGLLLCIIAPNFGIMMCGRVLQACGNGILMSMAQVIILTIYPDEQKGTAMGWYGLSAGAAPGCCAHSGGDIGGRIWLENDFLRCDQNYADFPGVCHFHNRKRA